MLEGICLKSAENPFSGKVSGAGPNHDNLVRDQRSVIFYIVLIVNSCNNYILKNVLVLCLVRNLLEQSLPTNQGSSDLN